MTVRPDVPKSEIPIQQMRALGWSAEATADKLGITVDRVRMAWAAQDQDLIEDGIQAVAESNRNRVYRVAPCGTRAAYRRHRRRGEPIDDACRLWCNADAREQYAARLRRAS